MSSKKTRKGSGKNTNKGAQLGMIGCGTPEIMFKAAVQKHLAGIDGVLGTETKPDRVKLLIRDESVIEAIKKVAPNMMFRGRPIVTEVTGPIVKQKQPK